MRLRKRANWPIVVYRYWVDPEYQTWEQLPGPIQQEAEAMRTLWNQLVEAFTQRQASYYNSLLGSSSLSEERDDGTLPSVMKTGDKPSPLALRQIQNTFLHTTQEISKTSPVSWGNKQFVTTQFFAALTRFFKKQGNPPQQRSGEFHDLHFQHRFTEGGLPVERVFGHSQRLALESVPADAFSPTLSQRQRKHLARTSGHFQVRDHLVRFRTILHRPLPPGAYLKAAALVGKKCTPSGYHWGRHEGHATPVQWHWSLQLTLEIPPPPVLLRTESRTAAVQVRCELVDERRLCFGILTDATGREKALFLPAPLLGSWRHRRLLQQQADHLLARTKQQLQNLPLPAQYPQQIQQMFSHLHITQAPGLWRLLQSLDDMSVKDEAVQILRHWATDSTKLLREARGLQLRYLGHRDWFYHNVAAYLCRRYQQLIITATEAELHISAARGGKDNTTERQEVGTYRQLAAPSRFVSFVQQAASKTGTTVTVTPRLRSVAHQ